MVGKHLSEVLPPLFQVDGQQLLQPEGKLDQVIPLQWSCNLPRRPFGPELPEVKPVAGRHEDMLRVTSQSPLICMARRWASPHHAHGEREAVIDKQPALLCKASPGFCRHQPMPCEELVDARNGNCPQSCKHNQPSQDKICVVNPLEELPVGLIVRQRVKPSRIASGSGQEGMCGSYCGY